MMTKLNALAGHDVVRFLLLGGLVAVVNWLVRFPLSAVLPLGMAVIVAYLIGMSVGFYLYRTYVFIGSNRPILQQTGVFCAVNLIGVAAVLALTYAFLMLQDEIGYPTFVKEALAHCLAVGLGAVVTFIGHKTLTFSQRKARVLPLRRVYQRS